MENLIQELIAKGHSFEEAIEIVYHSLQESKAKQAISGEFYAIVRFNRGLGIEYKNLPVIQATTIEEAKMKATEIAEKIVGGPGVDIREVRVRPKS